MILADTWSASISSYVFLGIKNSLFGGVIYLQLDTLSVSNFALFVNVFSLPLSVPGLILVDFFGNV